MALRGAWHFNEASGNAIDYGGLSVPLVPSGSALRVAGRNSVGRAIARGTSTSFSTTILASGATAITLYARFMYDGGSGDRGVFTLFSGSGSGERGGIYVNANKIGMWLDLSSGFKSVESNNAMQSGLWYDVFGVWDGSTMRLWVNGVLLPESTAATGNMPVVINGLMTTYNGAQTGDVGNGILVDQAMIWNHALTETEVMAALVSEPNAPALPAARFPAGVDGTGRYLVDTTSGAPHLLTLDSAWDLLHVNPNIARRSAYLQNRAAQGFNTVYVGLIRSDTDGGTTWYGRTPAGNSPFTGASPSAWNLASPDEPFWAEVDALLTAAEAVGITVILQPFTTWASSAYACYTNSTDSQVRTFGTWLGNRYKTRPNVMWLFGGDWGTPDATTTSRAEQLILGIRDSGDTHHFMVHMVEESDGHTGQAWTASSTLQTQQTVRATYTYVPTYYRSRVARAAAPAKPVFLIEANYEGNPRDSIATDAHVVRRQALWSLVGGGTAGHGYGHGKVFNFQQNGDMSFSWTTSLTTVSTQQLKALAARWRAMTGWQNLAPDTGNTLVTSGRGTERTTFVTEHVTANDYAPAAITADKSLAVVYVPSARAMTLDMTKVGSSPTITRVDPTGETADTTLTSTIASGSFPAHIDGTTDYLLVITATSSGTTVTKTGLATATGTASSAVTTSRTKSAAGLGSGLASSTKSTVRTKASTAAGFGTASSVVARISARAATGFALAIGSASAAVVTIRTLLGTARAQGSATSSVIKTEIGHVFAPPGRVVRRGGTHRLFGRMSLTQGVSLLKSNGLYRQVENPSDEEVSAADVAYLGGHLYHVTDSEAEALADAGYGAWLTLSEEQS